MNNNKADQKNMEVRNMGKIPENNTSESNSISFKVTPDEKSRIDLDRERSGFQNRTEYIKHKLFDNTPTFLIDSGHELLKKLSECVNLLSALHDKADPLNRSDFTEIANKQQEIEDKISFLFECVEAIKEQLIDSKEDK